jgi:hypothetical protein
MKKLTLLVSLSIVLTFVYAATCFSADQNSARLIPSDVVYGYENNQKIAEFKNEVPFPEEMLLKSQGDSGIKMDNILLVAEDKSEFSITTESDCCYITVKSGKVHFAISDLPKPLAFVTPQGIVTSRQLILNANSSSSSLAGMLQGTVSVDKNSKSSEYSVYQGGSLLLATSDGDRLINNNQQLLLAQADTGEVDTTTIYNEEEAQSYWSSLTPVQQGLFGVVAVGAVGAGTYQIIANNRSSNDGSPSTP